MRGIVATIPEQVRSLILLGQQQARTQSSTTISYEMKKAYVVEKDGDLILICAGTPYFIDVTKGRIVREVDVTPGRLCVSEENGLVANYDKTDVVVKRSPKNMEI